MSSKAHIVYFTIIIILLGSLMVLGAYVYKQKKDSSNPNTLLVNLIGKEIESPVLIYYLQGRLLAIKPSTDQKAVIWTLKPNSSNKSYDVKVNSEQEIYKFKDPLTASSAASLANIERVKVSEIKIGSEVKVFVNYNPKTQITTAGQIILLKM